MSVLCLILFLYGAAMTAALMVTNSTKDKYIRKYLDTQKMYEDLQKKLASQNTFEDGKTQAAPSISSAPAATPVPSRAEAPVMQRQPLPSYSAVPKKEPGKPGLGAVGVSFAVGVLLMVIAAAVFISATWQTMPAPFPSTSEPSTVASPLKTNVPDAGIDKEPPAGASVVPPSSQSPNDGAAESVTVLPPVNLSVPVPFAMAAGMVCAKLPVSNTAGLPVTETALVQPPADACALKTFAAPATIVPVPQLNVWL